MIILRHRYILFLLLGISIATQMQSEIPSVPSVPISEIGNPNWTTCDEFLEGTTFDASSILDKDWKVFYTWSVTYEEPYQVRFRVPTPALIDRFKVEVRNLSFAPEDWNDTAFFMESTMDLSALFIKTPTPGKFNVITSLVFQFNITKKLVFAMKVIDAGYLAFMNCRSQVVTALAPLHNFPKDKDVEEIAGVFMVRNPHGYSYNGHDPILEYNPALADTDDDAGDEEDIEVGMTNSLLD